MMNNLYMKFGEEAIHFNTCVVDSSLIYFQCKITASNEKLGWAWGQGKASTMSHSYFDSVYIYWSFWQSLSRSIHHDEQCQQLVMCFTVTFTQVHLIGLLQYTLKHMDWEIYLICCMLCCMILPFFVCYYCTGEVEHIKVHSLEALLHPLII